MLMAVSAKDNTVAITDVTEEKELRSAAHSYQRRARGVFAQLELATDLMDGEAAAKVWEAVCKGLELAEMAAAHHVGPRSAGR